MVQWLNLLIMLTCQQRCYSNWNQLLGIDKFKQLASQVTKWDKAESDKYSGNIVQNYNF